MGSDVTWSNYYTAISGLTQFYIEGGPPFTVPSGCFVSLKGTFPTNVILDRVVISGSNLSTSGITCLYTTYSGTQHTADGSYNVHTNYCTPFMETNNDPPGYIVSATTSWDDAWYAPWKAFNKTANDSMDCWLSGQGTSGYPPQYIMFGFAEPVVINKYALQARNTAVSVDRCFPTSFSLYGSLLESPNVSGTTGWVLLDTRVSVSDPGASGWSPYFGFSNSNLYRWYRLKVDNVVAGSHVAVANIKFIEYTYLEYVDYYTESNLVLSGSNASLSGVFNAASGVASFLVQVSAAAVIESIDFIWSLGIDIQVSDENALISSNNTKVFTVENRLDDEGVFFYNLSYPNSNLISQSLYHSTDYGINPVPEWTPYNTGIMFPYNYSFKAGMFTNTIYKNKTVTLSGSLQHGEWRSPVLDLENKLARAYIDSAGDIDIWVRSSDTEPAQAIFSMVTTETTHRWLMYDHKRVVIDSQGTVIDSNICDGTGDSYKVWRSFPIGTENTFLPYYADINDYGETALLLPGYTTCDDMSPEQEFLDSAYWYNFINSKLFGQSNWEVGTTVSGMLFGSNINVLLTKVSYIPKQDGFFVFVIAQNNVSYLSVAYMICVNSNNEIRSVVQLFTTYDVVLSSQRLDVAWDNANGGWWLYFYPYIYKIDPGGLDTTQVYIPNLPSDTPDEETYFTLSYLWKVESPQILRGLVAIPETTTSLFWGFNESTIFLMEEVYKFDDPSIIVRGRVSEGTQLEVRFRDLHVGSCDKSGNAWFLDLRSERVVRVNKSKLLNNETYPIDFESVIPGAVSLWVHPYSGQCYVLISGEVEHSEEDIIRVFSAGQRWGARGKYVCVVPGFCSYDYKMGINFIGKATKYLAPSIQHRLWGKGQVEANGALNSSDVSIHPNMSSKFLPAPFIVWATSEGGGSSRRQAWRAFTNTFIAGEGWQCSLSLPQSIMIVLDEPKTVNKYSMTAFVYNNTVSNFPTAWELQGLKDQYINEPDVFNDLQWQTIDFRSNITKPNLSNPKTNYFTFTNYIKYKAYRLRITVGSDGSSGLAIGNINLVGAEENLPWIRYTSGAVLPRGRYKQFKICFTRETEMDAAAILKQINIPKAVELGIIETGKSKAIAVRGDFSKMKVPGTWEPSLDVWMERQDG